MGTKRELGPHGFDIDRCPTFYDGCNCETVLPGCPEETEPDGSCPVIPCQCRPEETEHG